MVIMIMCFLLNIDFHLNMIVLGDMSGTEVYYYLQKGKRLDRPSRCPSSIFQLMTKCWEWEDNKRPTFSQLHQFLKTGGEQRETNRTTSTSTSNLVRTRVLKPTSSSLTLTDENIHSRRDMSDDEDNENSRIRTNEQYRNNGSSTNTSKANMRVQQIFSRDRIKS